MAMSRMCRTLERPDSSHDNPIAQDDVLLAWKRGKAQHCDFVGEYLAADLVRGEVEWKDFP